MSEFTGIWLPAEILSIKELNPTEKIVLGAIIPLAIGRPCTARNKHFSEKVSISETSISLNIKSLEEKGFLCVDPGTEKGNKREIHLFIKDDSLFKIVKDPSLTSLNTLFNFIKEPLKDSSRPYLRKLKTLFKNVKEPIYIDIESKEENKIESKQSNNSAGGDEKISESWIEKERVEMVAVIAEPIPPDFAAPPPLFWDDVLPQLTTSAYLERVYFGVKHMIANKTPEQIMEYVKAQLVPFKYVFNDEYPKGIEEVKRAKDYYINWLSSQLRKTGGETQNLKRNGNHVNKQLTPQGREPINGRSFGKWEDYL